MGMMGVQAASAWEPVVKRIDDAVRAGASESALDYAPGGMLGGGILWTFAPGGDATEGEIAVMADIAEEGFQVSVQGLRAAKSGGPSQRRVFWTTFVALGETLDALGLDEGVASGLRRARAWLTQSA